MKYKLEKLEQPIWRSGKRVFRYRIKKIDGEKETVFLFQDKKTAEDTLERLS